MPTLSEEMVNGFEALANSDCSEEVVHQYLDSNRALLGCLYTPFTIMYEDYAFSGALSRFPVAPDRIPDFTLFCIQKRNSNWADEIKFLELKRPSAHLYVDHGRMSKDLNDAWAESIGTLHLIGPVYKDFIRRLQSRITEDMPDVHFRHSPHMKCIILIGRRSTLSDDELGRMHELEACTSQTVDIMTFDTLIEINRHRLEDIRRIRESDTPGSEDR